MSEYIQPGYIATGFLDGDTPLYIDGGYIQPGYIDGDSSDITIANFGLVYYFQSAKNIYNKEVQYLYRNGGDFSKNIVSYLYDNQLSLDPIRIVREKIS